MLNPCVAGPGRAEPPRASCRCRHARGDGRGRRGSQPDQRVDRAARRLIANDEVARSCAGARAAGRVGSLDISKPRAAVQELRRCVRELGFKAVRVLPWLWELPPTLRASTRSTASAASWASRSARRSGTPARCAIGVRPADPVHRPGGDRLSGRSSWAAIGYPWTEEMIASRPSIRTCTSIRRRTRSSGIRRAGRYLRGTVVTRCCSADGRGSAGACSRGWQQCNPAPGLRQAFSAPMRGGCSASGVYFSWPRISPTR